MPTISRYGLDFNGDDHDDLSVEFWNIRKGQTWLATQGRSLTFHYENARKLLWPNLDDHRWHRLCRDEILKNKVTVLMGPGSSGKTHEAAWIYLIDYWCYPEETCVLVSSTTIPGLRKRVWGEITMLWEQGLEKYDWLPGNLLDHAIAITTDSLDDMEFGERKSRDMRKGIFGIPCVQGSKFVGLSKYQGIKQKRMRLIADEACFPSGTLIDTPYGRKPIESIKSGDLIYNAIGISKVKHAMTHVRPSLVKIKSLDGREIICTPNHPFFTNEGWKNACELNQHHYMVSTYEAMQLLSEDLSTNNPGYSLPGLSVENDGRSMRPVREQISKTPYKFSKSFLQSVLRIETSASRPEISKEILFSKTNIKDSENKSGHVQRPSREIRCHDNEAIHGHGKIYELSFNGRKASSGKNNESNYESQWTQSKNSRRKWNRPHQSRTSSNEDFPSKCDKQPSYKNWKKIGKWIPDQLQSRHSISGYKTGGGSGRKLAQSFFQKRVGCEENKSTNGSWVDSVEIYQQENFNRHEQCKRGITVYNLEVEGHPSFSVNGFLVHNSVMDMSFLSAFANLNKNEDFRAIILGNPADPLDPLGKSAEPKDGWTDEYLEPKQTKVWDTRFMGGRCVNLIGTDSPNFDFPADHPTRYKYLISKEKIDDTLSFFPKDSMEYYSQCVGTMKIGTISRRILSRELCIRFGAQKQVVWDGQHPRIKIYFVDSSYGGDRCVGGSGEIGIEIGGKQVLSFNEPKIIPILVGKEWGEPEEQISRYVKDDCEKQEIDPQNMGHDSTGRGALGTALAREWSAMTNPIEFGGVPTDRPVSLDIKILDEETNQMRYKTCREEYDRFTTELWYSVRYAVEAGQIRDLPDECMQELCTRTWDKYKEDKKKLEVKDGTPTKPGYKQRIGKSPDMGDWASGIVEMARRRGFQISKLGSVDPKRSKKGLDWLEKEAQEYADMLHDRELKTI